MKKMLTILLSAVVSAGLLCSCQAYYMPPTFDIDLDAEPETRYQDTVDYVLSAHSWNDSFGSVFAHYNQTLFQHVSEDDVLTLAKIVRTRYPEHASELDGISEAFASKGHVVTFEYLVLWVYFHELAHTTAAESTTALFSFGGCTALIVQSLNGSIIHGRNMDQDPVQTRNITVHHRYISDGHIVYEATDWYWFTTGFMTGMKPGVASVQENWRFSRPALSLQAVVKQLQMPGTAPQVFFFRNAFTSQPTFDAIVATLTAAQTAAPLYMAVAGASSGEGVIITRSEVGGVPPEKTQIWLKDAVLQGRAFLVQTNYDHWEPDPACDPRRTVAENLMDEFGPYLVGTEVSAFATIATPPVKNSETVYSVMMSADRGLFRPLVHGSMLNGTYIH